ncbi:MAG: GNAT family N-acetyltransferase [Anaerolineae bacterium]
MSLLSVTPFLRKHRHAAEDLLFRHYRVHTHLDWQSAESWLDTLSSPVWLAWQGQRLVGLMAVSEAVEGNCWMRLVALHDDLIAPHEVLQEMWQPLSRELTRLGVRRVALLLVRDWLKPFLEPLGFEYDEHIVTLFHGGHVPAAPIPSSELHIRSVTASDLDALVTIDHAAFPPMWRMSRTDLREALRISATCTLALQGETPVGYELCTQAPDAAHLARLAVNPHLQGKGIGAVLLADALARFARRGVYSMTVNTQASNIRSQRLYTRYGFVRNGYDLPVYVANLPVSSARSAAD